MFFIYVYVSSDLKRDFRYILEFVVGSFNIFQPLAGSFAGAIKKHILNRSGFSVAARSQKTVKSDHPR